MHKYRIFFSERTKTFVRTSKKEEILQRDLVITLNFLMGKTLEEELISNPSSKGSMGSILHYNTHFHFSRSTNYLLPAPSKVFVSFTQGPHLRNLMCHIHSQEKQINKRNFKRRKSQAVCYETTFAQDFFKQSVLS